MRYLKDKILTRIRAAGRGKVHSSKDFLDLGGRAAVDQALSRLVKEGAIRRVGRGLYDLPKTNPRLGIELSPDVDQVAKAVARKRGSRLQRSGADAANALGLSTQVPGRTVYLTDSSSAKVRFGKQTVTIKHVAPRVVAPRDKTTATVLQALHFVGKDGLTPEVLERLRGMLTDKDKARLLKESRYAVGWVADAVRRIIREDKATTG
jgi:hypothetical protein